MKKKNKLSKIPQFETLKQVMKHFGKDAAYNLLFEFYRKEQNKK